MLLQTSGCAVLSHSHDHILVNDNLNLSSNIHTMPYDAILQLHFSDYHSIERFAASMLLFLICFDINDNKLLGSIKNCLEFSPLRLFNYKRRQLLKYNQVATGIYAFISFLTGVRHHIQNTTLCANIRSSQVEL